MKKRILSINALSSGSTGKIAQGIAYETLNAGYDVKLFVGQNDLHLYPQVHISDIHSRLGYRLTLLLNKVFGLEGCFAFFSTLKLLKDISEFSPNIIHMHLLHHGYVNLPLLFHYIKKKKIPVIWTLHDCWSFTGHCPHFVYENCLKWQRGCFNCPRYTSYPRSLYDNSKFMWKWKKKWFSNIDNLTIVTPSKWLSELLSKSHLSSYNRSVIYNGIDLDVFKPTETGFRKKYSLEDKKIVLGVASSWSKKKGLDVFADLSGRLSDEYQIVLVGTNDDVDAELTENILKIHRTNNQKELAGIYSAADVFVNPTREEVLGLVNVEALACGTPVVTFNTGGSPECIDDSCGIVVDCDDVDSLECAVKKVCFEKTFLSIDCINRAQHFESKKRFYEYIELYNETLSKTDSQNL